MNALTQKTCEACRIGAPLATPQEREAYLPLIPEWEIIYDEKIEKLTRSFIFKDFKEAMDFSNKVADLAEVENHHPDLIVRYGNVTVIWYSHKIKGLHVNDFIMAAKTDAL